MALKPGTVDNFANSMASAMEEAFQDEWLSVKGTALLEAGEQDRKILFSAIAQGVVKHLKDNADDSFTIAVSVKQTNTVLIESDNPNSISVSGGGSISAGAADVRQKNTESNLVVSEGEATITEVITE